MRALYTPRCRGRRVYIYIYKNDEGREKQMTGRNRGVHVKQGKRRAGEWNFTDARLLIHE